MVGNIETHDNLCQQLAVGVPALVVNVDYRLAPEHRFPAAVDDAADALGWVADHASSLGGDPARLAVAGDSAGGNLAAVVSLIARDTGGPPIAFQLLIYPATDGTRSLPSHVENAAGYLLTADAMDWFLDLYLEPGTDRPGPRRVPALRQGPEPACRRPWSSRPSTTPCATKARRTPTGWARPGSRRPSRAIRE